MLKCMGLAVLISAASFNLSFSSVDEIDEM